VNLDLHSENDTHNEIHIDIQGRYIWIILDRLSYRKTELTNDCTLGLLTYLDIFFFVVPYIEVLRQWSKALCLLLSTYRSKILTLALYRLILTLNLIQVSGIGSLAKVDKDIIEYKRLAC
jgi:hypothetical protein